MEKLQEQNKKILNNLNSNWWTGNILSHLIFFPPLHSPSLPSLHLRSSPLPSLCFCLVLGAIFADMFYCSLLPNWSLRLYPLLKILHFPFYPSGRIISIAVFSHSLTTFGFHFHQAIEEDLVSFYILYFLVLQFLLAVLVFYVSQLRFSICLLLTTVILFKFKHFHNFCLKVLFLNFSFNICAISGLIALDYFFSYLLALFFLLIYMFNVCFVSVIGNWILWIVIVDTLNSFSFLQRLLSFVLSGS